MNAKRIEECGCCEVGISPTPEEINNRPGLSTLAYRVGTYASFRQAMIEAIAKFPELKEWTARQSDDYGIALLEIWAYLADILTFYQERIANEAFLRTALHRDTIMRLAAMLDYKLNPGVAATTYLTFFGEEAAKVNIPVGLRVQSVPGQDEKPQKFETVEGVLADARLNQVRVFPKPEFYNPFSQGINKATLSSSGVEDLSIGDKIVIFDATRAEFKEVSDISAFDHKTIFGWVPEIHASTFQPFTTKLAPYDRQFRLFGYNAPESYLESEIVDGTVVWEKKETDFSLSMESKILELDALYDDLKPNTQILIIQSGSSQDAPSGFARMATITEVTSQTASFESLQDTVTQISLDIGIQATPVVIQDYWGNLRIFTIGDDGALWTIKQTSSGWGSWISLGGRIDMLAVEHIGRLIEVVARGIDDQALWHIREEYREDNWSDWEKIHNMKIDRLAIGQNEDGRLEVFARGIDDQALWHMWQIFYDNKWSGGWVPLGNRHFKIDVLAVGQNADGRLEVFATIGEGKWLWHIWQEFANATHDWSWWSSLGRQVDLLAVGQNADGRLEVFAQKLQDQSVWHIWQISPNNGWSNWLKLGALEIDLLTVGQNADGRLEVFARKLQDQSVWHIWQTAPNNGWSNWAVLGAFKVDLLAVGQNADGRLEVFARKLQDQAVWHIWQTAPNNGWSNWEKVGELMWTISDRSQIRIFELTQPPINLWSHHFSESIPGTNNTVYVPLDQLTNLESGRPLILDDEMAKPQTVTVTGANPVDTDDDGECDHLAITFTPGLTRSLDTRTACFYGNVAEATHGETVSGEVLGSGDASIGFQEFILKKSPTTFVPAPNAPRGAKNILEVRIESVLWKEVESLYGQIFNDRVYIARVNDEGKMSVRFGDGKTGACLPTGQDNVVAKYRQGLGSEGNVRADSLTTLLDRPIGLKSVTNPKQAEGGTDPESLQEARTNAPNTVRTFERAISLRDYEDLARSYTGIAKAKATSILRGERESIQLTIAGENGLKILESSQTYKSFIAYLNFHRDTNHRVKVVPHDTRQVVLKVVIQVNPVYMEKEVLSVVRKAVLAYFDFDNLQLGEGIHLSNIYSIVQAVAGVTAAVIEYFDYKGAGTMIYDYGNVIVIPSLNEHLAIEPNQIAALEDADLEISSDLTSRV